MGVTNRTSLIDAPFDGPQSMFSRREAFKLCLAKSHTNSRFDRGPDNRPRHFNRIQSRTVESEQNDFNLAIGFLLLDLLYSVMAGRNIVYKSDIFSCVALAEKLIHHLRHPLIGVRVMIRPPVCV